jgi:hypothetical protein
MICDESRGGGRRTGADKGERAGGEEAAWAEIELNDIAPYVELIGYREACSQRRRADLVSSLQLGRDAGPEKRLREKYAEAKWPEGRGQVDGKGQRTDDEEDISGRMTEAEGAWAALSRPKREREQNCARGDSAQPVLKRAEEGVRPSGKRCE